MENRYEDLTGRRFGRLTVLGYDCTSKYRVSQWRVRCDCGTEFVASRANLISGNTRSCGCLKVEKASTAWKRHYERMAGVALAME